MRYKIGLIIILGILLSGFSAFSQDKDFYIFLWFDDADVLQKVKSAQFEAGCL